MRELHWGVELGVQSWPALLTIHEGRCRRAAEWESEEQIVTSEKGSMGKFGDQFKKCEDQIETSKKGSLGKIDQRDD